MRLFRRLLRPGEQSGRGGGQRPPLDRGGTVLFGEPTEFLGAEHLLARRAVRPQVGRKIVEIVARMANRISALGFEMRGGNPTPGNIRGGLTTIKAKVTADLLSCRYGPGAEYLYLYALRPGANIKLIGRTDGNNWVWVDGTNKCWVNSKFLDIAGDWHSLPVVYPGIARLPITPYYPAPSWASATRKGTSGK